MIDFIQSNLTGTVGLSIGGVVAAWILKKIPNKKLKKKFGSLCYGAGVFCTLGLSKWKLTASVWNRTIEPWIIDAIDNIIGNGIQEFIKGLRSDNK